jgi:hypothetical protein
MNPPARLPKPPSDWTGRAVLFGGAGCLGLVLALGLASSFALQRCAEAAQEAQARRVAPAQGLVDDLKVRDWKGAYGRMTPRYRKNRSLPQFQAEVERRAPWLLDGGEARLVHERQRPGPEGGRLLGFELLAPDGTSQGRLTLGLVYETHQPSGVRVAKIEDLLPGDRVELSDDWLEIEATLQLWLNLNGEGKTQQAWTLMSRGFAEQTGAQGLRRYVESQGALLQGGEARLLDLKRDADQAGVEVELSDEDGRRKGTARCQLRREGAAWRIEAIQTSQPLDLTP